MNAKSNLSVLLQIPDDCYENNSGELLELDDGYDLGSDVYGGDEFRMYEFKVRRCTRARSHDWTDCPFAHPGEKARRRDPRKYQYSASICPDYKSRGGCCPRGDACEFAHGVFECWLHPARYRTTPCRDGKNCRRKVCFFAHTRRQLRLLPLTATSNSPLSPTMYLSPTSILVGYNPSSPPFTRSRKAKYEHMFGDFLSKFEGMDISPKRIHPTPVNEPGFEWIEDLLHEEF